MKRGIRFAVKAAISAALLFVLWQNVDVHETLAYFAGTDPTWLLLAAASTTVLILADGVTLATAFKAQGGRLSWRKAYSCSFIGWFFGSIAPSNIGTDVYRVFVLRDAGASTGEAIRVTVAARLMAAVGLALVLVVCLPLALTVVETHQHRAVTIGVALFGVGGAALALSVGLALRAIGGSTQGRWRAKLVDMTDDLRRLALLRQTAGPAWISAVAQHLLRLVTAIMLSFALGLEIPVAVIVALVPTALLVAMVPISIAGWGVREAAFVTFFTMAGIAADKALGLSIALGLWRMAVGTCAGLFWLASSDRPRLSSPTKS